MSDGPDAMTGAGASAAPPELRRLDGRAVALWRLSSLWRGGLLTAGAVFIERVAVPSVPTGVLAGAVAVLAVVVAVVVPPLRYRAWGFALRDTDLYLRNGVLFRTTSIVPNARIQHVDTRHGPLDRWLGLASVVVFTAGHRGAIIAIPALAADEAEEIRDRLAARSGVGDAV